MSAITELRIRTNAEVGFNNTWITEKFPGAIRIGRDSAPWAFGEDVAAVHPELPDVARDLIDRYNSWPALLAACELTVSDLEASGIAAALARPDLVSAIQSATGQPQQHGHASLRSGIHNQRANEL